VLLIGASRGLGLALAEEYLKRGWDVTATVRGTQRAALHELADNFSGQLIVEKLDINVPKQVAALRERLSGARFGLLFVNAAITNGDVPVGEVPTQTFIDVMVTNALSPLRVVEALHDLVSPDGTIALMSSRQGSVSLNERGGHEVYRASKSALNQLMRSYAARNRNDPRTLLLINPGHVRTELGGPDAPFTAAHTIPGVVDTIEHHRGDGGLQFRNWEDEIVPW
jgi:NAD(P)-dependent dehydrogenase (short-subunit alcohol dehydrogenase family)